MRPLRNQFGLTCGEEEKGPGRIGSSARKENVRNAKKSVNDDAVYYDLVRNKINSVT